MSGSIHCPQCRMYITSEYAEVCPRCGQSLEEARAQRSGSLGPIVTYAPPPWPAATQYATPYAPNPPYETPYAPNEGYWPDESGPVGVWQPVPQKRRGGGEGRMLKGCLFALAGIALTAGSYALTPPGGHYFLFYGLILYGGFLFLRGWIKGDD